MRKVAVVIIIEGVLICVGAIVEVLTSDTPVWVWPTGIGLGVIGILALYRQEFSLFARRLICRQRRREYTARTVGMLFAEFTNGTYLEAKRSVASDLGKWIVVHDVVRNVFQNGNFVYIMLGKPLTPALMLRFEQEQLRGEPPAIGDKVHAQGMLAELEAMEMHLQACEFVNPLD